MQSTSGNTIIYTSIPTSPLQLTISIPPNFAAFTTITADSTNKARFRFIVSWQAPKPYTREPNLHVQWLKFYVEANSLGDMPKISLVLSAFNNRRTEEIVVRFGSCLKSFVGLKLALRTLPTSWHQYSKILQQKSINDKSLMQTTIRPTGLWMA